MTAEAVAIVVLFAMLLGVGGLAYELRRERDQAARERDGLLSRANELAAQCLELRRRNNQLRANVRDLTERNEIHVGELDAIVEATREQPIAGCPPPVLLNGEITLDLARFHRFIETVRPEDFSR